MQPIWSTFELVRTSIRLPHRKGAYAVRYAPRSRTQGGFGTIVCAPSRNALQLQSLSGGIVVNGQGKDG